MNVIHPLVDILKLVMIAVLCRMDELDKIIDYGENKKEFDIKLITSKSTLTRVIAMINPRWLSLSIVCILNTLIKNKATQIMLDGKAIKSTDAISTIEKSHGRVEKRTCYVLNELEFFTDYKAELEGLKKIFAVKREVERNEKRTKAFRLWLSLISIRKKLFSKAYQF